METTSQITAQETATIRNRGIICSASEVLNNAIACGRDHAELKGWRLALMLDLVRRALVLLNEIDLDAPSATRSSAGETEQLDWLDHEREVAVEPWRG